jgi:septation ring formation regulator EzrA
VLNKARKIMIQLDFFKDVESEECLREEIARVKASNDKVRKSMFAKHGELAKLYVELDHRLNIIERNICRKS